MRKEKLKIYLSSVFVCMILLSFFNIGILKTFSTIVLVLSILGVLLLSCSKSLFIFNKASIYILIPLFFLSGCYMLSALSSINPLVSIQRGILIFIYAAFFLFYFKVGQADYLNRFRAFIFYTVVAMLLILILNFHAAFLFWNANSLGIYLSMLFLILLFFVESNLIKLVSFIMACYFLSVTGSRTAFLAYFFSCCFYSLSYFIYKSKILYYGVFVALVMSGLSIIILTINEQLLIFSDINQKISNKNIESGRDLIWPIVLNLILEKPIWGHGGGINLSDISNITFSSHNLYLQIGVQVGVVGLLFLLIFYLFFWRVMFALYDNYGNIQVRVSGSIFLWIIIIQNFEITLFQNNIILSLPAFGIMSYFLGKSYEVNHGIMPVKLDCALR